MGANGQAKTNLNQLIMDFQSASDSENQDNATAPKESGFDHKIVCVTYPGIVKNVDKMLETLGGVQKLEHAVVNRSRPLELRFRPKDIFSKPAIADKDSNSSLLVKVTVKLPENNSSPDEHCYNYEVVGVPTLTFTFNKHTDFQYLPLVSRNEETFESCLEYVSEELYPSQLPTYQEALIKGTEASLPFLPPRNFVKHDFSSNKLHFERANFYAGPYRPDVAQSIKEQAERNRLKERSKFKTHGSIFCKFKDKDVPTKPAECVIQSLRDGTISAEKYMEIKEHFEQRPIWSKIALQHILNISSDLIKALLPTVAYYASVGPWRIMWIKFGYDPRTDPEARKYQTFDFRLRTAGGIKYLITPKRYKVDQELDFRNPLNFSKKLALDESFYIYKPDILPPARQMFYQYCDLHFPKIQAMMVRLPTIPADAKCNSKTGWLPQSFSEQCREIMCQHIVKLIQSQFSTTSQVPRDDRKPSLSQPVSSSSGEDKEKDSLATTFDLMEISDTDEEDSDEEFVEYSSSEEDKSKFEQSDLDDGEIDSEIVDEINQFVTS